jgi:membrane protease YdiL (CAAX protease family)
MTIPFKADIEPTDLFSKSVPYRRAARIFQFPLVRFVVVALFLLPVFACNALVVFFVIEQVEEPLASNVDIVRMALTIPLLLLSYGLYCRTFEKRKALEISTPGAGKESTVGFLVATTLVVLHVALISIFGSFEIVEYRPPSILLKNILLFGMGSLFQDLILLGVLFRLVEEFAGTWVALAVSLVIFGFAHLANPNQTPVTAIFLVLSSIFLIAPFILTRRIWLSWGIHAGWNFMQAGVFGMANSGILFPGWMVTQVGGAEWLTGGAIGLEGSYLASAIDLSIGLLILFVAINAGKIVEPRWKRLNRDSASND